MPVTLPLRSSDSVARKSGDSSEVQLNTSVFIRIDDLVKADNAVDHRMIRPEKDEKMHILFRNRQWRMDGCKQDHVHLALWGPLKSTRRKNESERELD